MRVLPKLTAGLLCLVLSLVVQTAARAQSKTEQQAWHELLAFKNRNLQELDEETQERIATLANQILPERKNDPEAFSVRMRRPWLLREFKATKRQTGYVLLDSQAVVFFPGQAIHYLYFFDARGKLLNLQFFTSGWRMMPGEATLVEDERAFPYLVVSASGIGGFAFAPFIRQYYALRGGAESVLIRIEGKDGEALRNSYECLDAAIGPRITPRDADEWAAALTSTDEVEVLRSLMWFGGKHGDVEASEESAMLPDEGRPPRQDKRLSKCPEVAAVGAKLFARADVKRTLDELAASLKEWIRQAAELTRATLSRRRSP
ncbi:MAG: hypothetical protein QOE47_68, partial [Pyrinomonadaceae bacterium]|nr:hypothetical protein [Pyrinomonadaceae bacterium]